MRDERDLLRAACEAAAGHWSATLWGPSGESGRRYLAERRMDEATARAFGLGYAPAEWHDLHHALTGRGHSLGVLVKAGLLVASDNPHLEAYDRFRDRLVFPIGDLHGAAIAFGGRALSFAPGSNRGPKYLNTPETPIFKKSRALFGLPRAREAIRKARSAVLVEGYFDVMALHQVGILETVGVCGTALSDDQVDLLRRSGCERVTLLFDGDAAGAAAPRLAASAILRAGLEGRVARLPTGKGKVDPHDLAVSRGKAGVEAVLESAAPLTEYLIEEAISAQCDASSLVGASVEERLRTARSLIRYVLACGEERGLARSAFEKRIARRLDLGLTALKSEIRHHAQEGLAARDNARSRARS